MPRHDELPKPAARPLSTARFGDGLAARWVRRSRTPVRRALLSWRSARLLAHRHGPPPRVLDVGCGIGDQLAQLAPEIAEGVGIDPDPAMIREARARYGRRARLRFLPLSLEEAEPARIGSFDLVLFVTSLEHLADAKAALARARRLLRPGGRVLVWMPHPRHPRSLVARLGAACGRIPPFRHLTPAELERAARAAGLVPCPLPARERLAGLISLVVLGSFLSAFTAAPTADPAGA